MHLTGNRPDGRPHDVGGTGDHDTMGPLDREDRPLALWEKRVDIIQCKLAAKGLTTVDRLRHAIENPWSLRRTATSVIMVRWPPAVPPEVLKAAVRAPTTGSLAASRNLTQFPCLGCWILM